MNLNKKKIQRLLSIFFGLFIIANILLYSIEYKRYVSSAPIQLKEARKDIVNAMMFHIYYVLLVKNVRIDFLNPILSPLKVPRDYFYNKAIDELPKNDAERAMWFDMFEVRPYNFSVSAHYGGMTRRYGKEFSKAFIQKVYKNIEVLSLYPFQDKLTPDLHEDALKVHIDLINLYIYDFHLHPEGFLYRKETMENLSTDFETYKRFQNIYNWNTYFLKNNQQRYEQQFKHAFDPKRGWYSPYKNYYANLLNLSSFILFYKVKNDIFDCSKDQIYLKNQQSSGSAFNYLLKSYPKKSKERKHFSKHFFYLVMPNDLDNNIKNRHLNLKNALNLRVSCKYEEKNITKMRKE